MRAACIESVEGDRHHERSENRRPQIGDIVVSEQFMDRFPEEDRKAENRDVKSIENDFTEHIFVNDAF